MRGVRGSQSKRLHLIKSPFILQKLVQVVFFYIFLFCDQHQRGPWFVITYHRIHSLTLMIFWFCSCLTPAESSPRSSCVLVRRRAICFKNVPTHFTKGTFETNSFCLVKWEKYQNMAWLAPKNSNKAQMLKSRRKLRDASAQWTRCKTKQTLKR